MPLFNPLVVGTDAIEDDAVTLAKMAPGTSGNLIAYNAGGDPAAVATGAAGEVLTSNGPGLAPTMQTSGGLSARQVATMQTFGVF